MFGNFEFKKEELEEEVSLEKREAVFEDFDKKEAVIQKEAEGFLMRLVPEKFKKEAVGLLAAFSMFTASSAAFAEGFKGEKIDKEKLLPPEQSDIIKLRDENKIAPFDWKKVVDKIEISAGGEFEKISKFEPDRIKARDYDDMVKSDFYEKFSRDEFNSAILTELGFVFSSYNAKEFFTKLAGQKEGLADEQKALILQYFGKALAKTYNFDMLEKKEYVEVSDDIMFQSIKDLLLNEKITKTGKCGNIHTFLTRTAESLGMEAWLQSGLQGGGGVPQGRSQHTWSGMVVESEGKKQIVFLNYSDLIPTGTMDYRDAKGIYERYAGAVDAFDSFVGNEKEILFPVESRAQEVIKKAAGFEDASERLEAEIAEGELKKENKLEIKLSPEAKEIKLDKNTFGLAFFNYQDFYNNPYQSLEDLNALRGRLSLRDERVRFEAEATILHMNIKDLYKGSVVQDEVILRLAQDYIDSHKFNKSDYGQFAVNFGATLQAGLRLPIDNKIDMSTIGGMGNTGAGMRLIYINPAETGKFYVGAQEMFRGQLNDFQNQDLIIKEVAKTLTVGAEVKVNEAQIVNLEAAQSELDWGKKLEIKGGLEGGEWRGGVKYEKAESEYERFVPSSEKISAEVGYKGGPKWGIDVLGSKKTEKYAGAESEDIYGAEVKLKIFLW